ncbi:serine/threonine-protein kinase [Streptomyces fumanus]|uniref:serine/threonine-protein kinase n=1 Tax=Streptomyces fumanus TaxID=67302 RepID=UPI00340CEDD2
MGEVFAGRYELVDPIGRGGVGAVWRAWDHRRKRYVAAKVLQQRDAHSLLRFVREQALRIDHPHVLAPASWAADDDKVLFTMDLVTGGSLVHLVGDYGPLPPGFVCTLLDQLLSGLAAVHAEDVVHRDIKPANVLLEATGTGRPRLRLGDFGIAMRLGEPRLTEADLVVGTPGYLAPEQVMGAEPDFPADLFAVGLVALYLLQGAKPDTKALVRHFAEHGTPGAPRGIPEPLWQVVATLVQPDPLARFRTATGARKALAGAAELLPEPGPDDEKIEIFDQVGALPPGFGPDGPIGPGRSVRSRTPSGASESQVAREPGDLDPGADTGSSGQEPPSAPDDPRGVPSFPQSDTGSFHLPPPQATTATTALPPRAPRRGPQQAEQRPQQQQPEPSSGSSYPPNSSSVASFPYSSFSSSPHTSPPSSPHTSPPSSPHTSPPSSLGTAPAYPEPDRVDAPTASYTARAAQVPPSAPAPSSARRRAHRLRRPGPPAKVVIPVLLLSLLCYAVGIWALTRL